MLQLKTKMVQMNQGWFYKISKFCFFNYGLIYRVILQQVLKREQVSNPF